MIPKSPDCQRPYLWKLSPLPLPACSDFTNKERDKEGQGLCRVGFVDGGTRRDRPAGLTPALSRGRRVPRSPVCVFYSPAQMGVRGVTVGAIHGHAPNFSWPSRCPNNNGARTAPQCTSLFGLDTEGAQWKEGWTS
ncbi:hypothetical protein DPEC_G00270900 [Dallia pectoralis]|uniref:Uncharacterized protein n=1 Tax=Dallia pectoralis TaxID=75939 RepID=A0ACC2FPZ0_DALPE|nr:hypothetical protein DPEC_G00270900 [Dallia pectoralis]